MSLLFRECSTFILPIEYCDEQSNDAFAGEGQKAQL